MVRVRPRAASLLVASGWLMLGCQGIGRAVPAPIPVPPDNLPQARDQILEIARKQPYDVNPGASARALLDEGVEVTIEPQDGVYRLQNDQLAGGRVVARFINHGDKPVRRYGLTAGGSSYWVIYQQQGEWLSAIISDSRDRGLDRYGLQTRRHAPTRPWLQSIAQWQLPDVLGRMSPGGGELPPLALGKVAPWITCAPMVCCRVEPDDPPE